MSKRILKSLSLCFALCLLLSCCPGCTLLLSSERTWPFGAKETPEVGDATAPPGEDGPTGETAAPAPTEPIKNTVTFSETTLASTDACVVTATGFDTDGIWGPTLNILLENKSDKTLMFTAEGATVNGFMCDPYWACEVPAGKKANSQMSWMDSSLATCGINYIDRIEFTLRAYDSSNYSGTDVLHEAISLSLDNSTSAPPVSEVAYANPYPKQTLIDSGSFLVALDNYNPEDSWGATLALYIENRSDKTLTFTMDDTVVNGFMCSAYWSCEVAPGKKAISIVTWSLEQLEKSGVNYPQTVACNFRVYDSDDWTADDVYNQPLSLELTVASSQPPVREMKFPGGFKEQTIVDDESVRLVAVGFDTEANWGPTLIFYCENKSDKSLTLMMEDVAVNDFVCSPYWYLEIAPGAKAYSECSWSTSDLEANGIAKFEAVDFTLRAYESDNWSGRDLINGIFRVEF